MMVVASYLLKPHREKGKAYRAIDSSEWEGTDDSTHSDAVLQQAKHVPFLKKPFFEKQQL